MGSSPLPQTSQTAQGAGDRCPAAPLPGKCPLFARPQLLRQDSALSTGTNAGSNAWTLLGRCEEQWEQPAPGFVTATSLPKPPQSQGRGPETQLFSQDTTGMEQRTRSRRMPWSGRIPWLTAAGPKPRKACCFSCRHQLPCTAERGSQISLPSPAAPPCPVGCPALLPSLCFRVNNELKGSRSSSSLGTDTVAAGPVQAPGWEAMPKGSGQCTRACPPQLVNVPPPSP